MEHVPGTRWRPVVREFVVAAALRARKEPKAARGEGAATAVAAPDGCEGAASTATSPTDAAPAVDFQLDDSSRDVEIESSANELSLGATYPVRPPPDLSFFGQEAVRFIVIRVGFELHLRRSLDLELRRTGPRLGPDCQRRCIVVPPIDHNLGTAVRVRHPRGAIRLKGKTGRNGSSFDQERVAVRET